MTDQKQITEEEVAASEVFTTHTGYQVRFRAVRAGPVRKMLMQLGGPKVLTNPESLLKLEGSAQLKASQVGITLVNYCLGWGVELVPDDELSDDALAELEILGLASSNSLLAKANWIRFVVLTHDDDISLAIGHVLALTAQKYGKSSGMNGAPKKPKPKPKPEQVPALTEAKEDIIHRMEARIADLEAKLAETS